MRRSYFITFHTYGTWLPGDARGSVDRFHNRVGTPTLALDPVRLRQAIARQRAPALVLDGAMRDLVHRTIVEVCDFKNWRLDAINVRTNHVHVVVTSDLSPERTMGALKSRCSRLLADHGLVERGRPVWASHGSTRWLNTTEGFVGAIDYVRNRQGPDLVSPGVHGPSAHAEGLHLMSPSAHADGSHLMRDHARPSRTTTASASQKSRLRADMRDRARERMASPKAGVPAAFSDLRYTRVFDDLRVVLLFAPLPTEPDITPIARAAIGAGKTVCVPRLDAADRSMEATVVRDWDADLVPASIGHGVREPRGGLERVPPDRLELVLVPGLAFDLRGGRLGRGGGYYDRFLPRCSARARFVGVCFDEQIVDRVPTEPHDVRVHAILTPSGLREIGR